jgi:hypothetical protein
MNKSEDSKTDYLTALSIYHNTPRSSGGLSPSRLFYGRKIRLPELPTIPDMIDEELAGQDSRLDRVRDKEKRNKKVT